MKVGYVRVSTQEQNTARQEVLMQELGVEQLYIDKASGKNTGRSELKKMLAYVRRGDTVIVESISRFARNTRALLDLVEQLTAKQVEFVSRKEAIDTMTPTGKFMLTIFGGGGRAGTGVYFAAPAGGDRNCEGTGKVQGEKARSSPGV